MDNPTRENRFVTGCAATTGRRSRRARAPRRGEIWWLDFSETVGHEQAGPRPALILSDPRHDPRWDGNLHVVPITTRDRGVPLHVRVSPRDGGLPEASVLLIDQVRAVSRLRFRHRMGAVSPALLFDVEKRIATQLLPGWSPPETTSRTTFGPVAG